MGELSFLDNRILKKILMNKSESENAREAACEVGFSTHTEVKKQLPDIVEDIITTCDDDGCFDHIDAELIPSRNAVIDIIYRLRELLFPGYFSKDTLDRTNIRYEIGRLADTVYRELSQQITRSLRHECRRYEQPCVECEELGYKEAATFLRAIAPMRKALGQDVRAAYQGDPAAKSYDEIVFSYPGIFAVTVYRVAHQLFKQEIPVIPRMMTEYAHGVTGIDIHPGADIDESFFIDHGTGVVVGETTVIGKRVRLYQGVTLGALSLPRKAVDDLRVQKRHPTIEDDVIVYAGATILGGDTVVGKGSVIGGNVWITESVPPNTKVWR